jgi:glycogen(starch) synthase
VVVETTASLSRMPQLSQRRSEPTRVAIFASSFHPHLGGVEELVAQLARQFNERGHPTIVVTNRWPRDLPESELINDIRVFRFPFRTLGSGPRAWLSYVSTTWAVTKRIERLMTAEKVSLLHVQCVGPNGLYALRVSKRMGLPLVVTTQGEITMDASRIYQRSRFLNTYLRRLCARAVVVTAVSHKTANDLTVQIGTRPTKLKIISNGVNLAEFSDAAPRRNERPYISSAGRLVPQKGFDILIRSYSRSGLRGLDLLIAGDGPDRQKLEQLAIDLNLTEQVQLLGRLDHKALAELHAGAEYFVIPSITDEGLPLACVEALASGLPVVATRSGGIEELVKDGIHGLLVDMRDEEGLSEALLRLSSDLKLRSRMSLNARAQAERFDWQILADEYLKAFEEAVVR